MLVAAIAVHHFYKTVLHRTREVTYPRTFYSVTLLPAFPGGHESIAYGVNDAGAVVGRAGKSDMDYEAVQWIGSKIVPLGTLGGSFSEARAINNSGQVVGSSMTKDGIVHAFMWSRGHMNDLGTLPNGLYSFANDINDSGDIVGFGGTSARTHGILWSRGKVVDLGTMADFPGSSATAINRAGTVVGGGTLDLDEGGHAFMRLNIGQLLNIGLLPRQKGSLAEGLNNTGFVVGMSGKTVRRSHPFVYKNGTMVDLGVNKMWPFGVAMSANDRGMIAGYFIGSFETHACTWQGHQMTDLNNEISPTSGWDLLKATRINNRGQIIGKGRYNGREMGFLLTPVSTLPGAGHVTARTT